MIQKFCARVRFQHQKVRRKWLFMFPFVDFCLFLDVGGHHNSTNSPFFDLTKIFRLFSSFRHLQYRRYFKNFAIFSSSNTENIILIQAALTLELKHRGFSMRSVSFFSFMWWLFWNHLRLMILYLYFNWHTNICKYIFLCW